jgi:4-carboxymuconolactone decarboxylase
MADAHPPRFPPLSPEAMTEAQRRTAERISGFGSSAGRGPFPAMLRSPGAEHIMALSDYVRFHVALDQRLAEFAILIHARLWTDQYEWQAHEPRALAVGLDAAVIADLKAGRRPAAMRPDEAALYAYSVALSRRRAVDDAVFADAVARLGEAGVADLTVVLGLYAMVSYLLGVSEVGTPAGMAPPLAALAEPLPLE